MWNINTDELKALLREKKSEFKVLWVCMLGLLFFWGTIASKPAVKVVIPEDAYLLIHLILELFSVCVAMLIFVISCLTAKRSNNLQVVFVGGVFLAAGLLDLFHALSYNGMPQFFTPNSIDKAIAFGLMVRITVVLGMILCYLTFEKIRWSEGLQQVIVLVSLLYVTIVSLWIIFLPNLSHVFYIPGEGLTKAKIVWEYGITLFEGIPLIIFIRLYMRRKDQILLLVIEGLFFFILSGITFAQYVQFTDMRSFLGHAYKVVGYYLFFRAVFLFTIERPYQQLAEKEEAILRSEKLSSLGQMAAGMAHEVRNPLTTIRLFLQILKGKKDIDWDKAGIREFLEIALVEIDRANRIITEFLDFAKPKELHLELLHLQKLLDDMLILCSDRALMENKIIQSAYEEVDPVLEADIGQMKQVLLNLLNNALDAVCEGGNVCIGYLLHRQKKRVEIYVRDNGCGISQANLERIFDPFFTTKEEKGTGLGLAICHSIVEQHGGYIEVDSTLGKGTEFSVFLPYKELENPEQTEINFESLIDE